MTFPIVILAICSLVDVITTWRALKIHGLKEGWPPSVWIMDRVGLRGWIAVKVAVYLGAGFIMHLDGSTAAMMVLAAVNGAVAYLNWQKIRGA